MSLADLRSRVNAIEEGYEFFLAYASQGLAAESGGGSFGGELRGHLRGFIDALDGLEAAFRARLTPTAEVEAALEVLRRDAWAAGAMARLVEAEPAISSQLIDNLNASIHVRALLTDMFLLADLAEV